MKSPDLKKFFAKYPIDVLVEFRGLRKLGLCEFMPEEKYITLTGKWNDLPEDFDKMFEAVWELWGKIGNRQDSVRMLKKYLKAGYSYNNLIEKYMPSYIEYISGTNLTQMYLASFLNPEEKKFEQTYKKNAFAKQVDNSGVGIAADPKQSL